MSKSNKVCSFFYTASNIYIEKKYKYYEVY